MWWMKTSVSDIPNFTKDPPSPSQSKATNATVKRQRTELAVGLLDLLLGGRPRHAQDVVVVGRLHQQHARPAAPPARGRRARAPLRRCHPGLFACVCERADKGGSGQATCASNDFLMRQSRLRTHPAAAPAHEGRPGPAARARAAAAARGHEAKHRGRGAPPWPSAVICRASNRSVHTQTLDRPT